MLPLGLLCSRQCLAWLTWEQSWTSGGAMAGGQVQGDGLAPVLEVPRIAWGTVRQRE